MKKTLVILIVMLGSFASVNAGNWELISKIVASDRRTEDYFSSDLAISGNFAIVGAYREDQHADEGGFLEDAGAAYIFRFNGSDWVQMQKLTAPVRVAEDHFGYTVDICGNYAIIGAPRKDDTDTDYGEGVAFVYYYDGSSWVMQDKLMSNDRRVGDHFGYSVALNEDHAVIGAIYEDENEDGVDSISSAGSAYVFSAEGLTGAKRQRSLPMIAVQMTVLVIRSPFPVFTLSSVLLMRTTMRIV
ncbi:MAG: FG-GAP repeat protein [Candidatus Marinimicrobia bacterium]|nr:FG-GAP repeat protein [Candidatus Neomarinimicrobiota bacterium]